MARTPWQTNKTTTERGYGWQWQKLRKVILERDQHLCKNCRRQGRLTPATQVDHIVPKAKAGTDHPDNLQSLCGDCHDEKTARDNGRKRLRMVGPDGYPI